MVPYLIGFAYAMIVGHFLISSLMELLWKSAEEEGIPELPVRKRFKYHPMMLGVLERGLYAAAWHLQTPQFIAIWLALKASGQWKSSGADLTGRLVLNLFLIGNGFSIAYGVAGGALIDWVKQPNYFAGLGVPVSLIAVNFAFCLWAWRASPRQKPRIFFQTKPLAFNARLGHYRTGRYRSVNYNNVMRQPVELTGPGASPEDVAAALGVTPERQAAIREILRLHRDGNSSENGSKHRIAGRKASKKRSGSRK